MYKLFWILTIVITIMEFIDCCIAVSKQNKNAFNYHYWKLVICIFMNVGWIIFYVKGVI